MLVGLPLTIALGFGAGVAVLPDLSLLEVALLATMLAPTDAALGKAVVTDPRVPENMREGLNVDKYKLLLAAEGTGDTLAMLTWVVFGAGVVGQAVVDGVSGTVILYSLLSLTVLRMLPVFLALAGTGLDTREKLFVGWFGPRGLASIVFIVIVAAENLPGSQTLASTVICTIVLSVVAHGLSANPLVAKLAAWLKGSQA